jgi:hypothetical protein
VPFRLKTCGTRLAAAASLVAAVLALAGSSAAHAGVAPTTETAACNKPIPAVATAVCQFYQDINARDFRAAYRIAYGALPSALQLQSYQAGYAATRHVSVQVTGTDAATARVDVIMTALQRDGASQVFAGYYVTTLPPGARITGADIRWERTVDAAGPPAGSPRGVLAVARCAAYAGRTCLPMSVVGPAAGGGVQG